MKTDNKLHFSTFFQLIFAFSKYFAGDSNRQISDLKFKLVKAEQEVTALEQNVKLTRVIIS